MFSLFGPEVWYYLLMGVAGAVGYWLRHQQGGGLPGGLDSVIKNLFAQQQHAESCGLLCQLANHARASVPALQVPTPAAEATGAPASSPSPLLPADIAAALASLLDQRRQQAAHAALAAVVTPSAAAPAPTSSATSP